MKITGPKPIFILLAIIILEFLFLSLLYKYTFIYTYQVDSEGPNVLIAFKLKYFLARVEVHIEPTET